MDSIKSETVEAIRADEFAHAAIEAAITVLYLHGRDWSVMSRTKAGGLAFPFENEDMATAFLALCQLVDRTEPPKVRGKVSLNGGPPMPLEALQQLEASIQQGARP